ncbi:hypothetical protein ZIOFF_071335 [Zingiber officinale]|uniref:LysM domain-containing protein n=1 Tax=Zingiber officinale TaxID=94328 RepID=A0A8J5C153_ZINOF|nr:hypothetical protein ZIOFF_071335 [Zingiber officinale]
MILLLPLFLVSKFDTLAGVAIKYGVEIADIKKINGLTTDLQMFAHKILLIPLPGRHPPSTPIQCNGSLDDRGDSATNSPRRDILDSLQLVKLDFLQNSEISPAMSTLQNYYDLLYHKNGSTAKSTEITVYETRGASYSEDEMLPKASTASETQPRRSMCILRSCYHSDNSYYGNTLLLNKSGDASNGEKSKLDESVKRRQKDDTDALSAPEEIIEGLINRIGRGLAPKALLTSLMDYRSPTQDTSQTNSLLAVMKSFSSLSLQEENYSIWSYSRWSLKPDSITKPIFSSLPKQIYAWRSKAALD